MTRLVGARRRRRSTPAVWAFLAADDAELLPYDCAATLRPRGAAARAPGLLDRRGARRGRGARSTGSPAVGLDAERRGRPLRDRAAARRRSAARSTPAGRGTTRSRRRSASTSPTPASEAVDGDRGASPRTILDRAEARGRHADARLHAPAARASRSRSATTCSPGSRCSTATARASRSRGGAGGAVAARRGRARRLDAAAAAAARRAMRNSLDAVADRDFALDYLYAVRRALRRTSRGSARSSSSGRRASSASRGCPRRRRPGSSMMPQKLNPDVAELVRGKAGTAIGRLAGLLAVGEGPAARLRPRSPGGQGARLRGAPRRRRWRSARWPCSSRGSSFDRERLAAACADPLLLATDAAEALVRDGMPFRDAHEQVATQVREGIVRRPSTHAPRPAPGAGRCPRGARRGENALRCSTRSLTARRSRTASSPSAGCARPRLAEEFGTPLVVY